VAGNAGNSTGPGLYVRSVRLTYTSVLSCAREHRPRPRVIEANTITLELNVSSTNVIEMQARGGGASVDVPTVVESDSQVRAGTIMTSYLFRNQQVLA